MTVYVAHRSNLSGRRPVKIDGRLVGECRILSRRHGAGTEVLFFLPRCRDYFAVFETMKDLRARLPAILAQDA